MRGVRETVEAVWRLESVRIVGGLLRLVGELTVAEDLAQEALVAALERWPASGVPDNPGAWLTTTARRRGLDWLRRQKRQAALEAALEAERPGWSEPAPAAGLDDELGDDTLRLIYMACHPALPHEARAALTLKVVGGLTTEEIARAYLVPTATLAQRIVRAKRLLAERRVGFELPPPAERAARTASVLEVIYLIFNEGYAASSGAEWTRPVLCEEALRLGRILAARTPGEPEVHGLLALLELQASRLAARRGPDGAPVLLLAQDRRRWDGLLIRRGLQALDRAVALGGLRGPYTLQAAIAACHARAREPERTDWAQIVALYGLLAEVTGSPVVELNRAVAVGMAEGPAAGLALVDLLVASKRLERYPLLPSVRGHLLLELGRREEARRELERAAAMTENEPMRAALLARAAEAAG